MRITLQQIFLIISAVILGIITVPRYVYAVSAQSTDVAEVKPTPIKLYAFERIRSQWGREHWEAFDFIIRKESQWTHTAQNPTSSAYGLCQTMMSLYSDDLDLDFKSNPYKQIDWCIWYTENRYENPIKAKEFWDSNNWW